MNTNLKTILSTAVLVALSACDSGNGRTDFTNRSLLSNDGSSTASNNFSAIMPGAADLVITGHNAETESDHSTSFTINIADNTSAAIDTSMLSFAIEYSKSTDFANSYRSALFNLQYDDQPETSSTTASARTHHAKLPSGDYFARVIVNPNWQMYFENPAVRENLSQPFYYIAEANYTNNYSDIFQISVQSDITCIEDQLENNNSFTTATALSRASGVRAALCEDNIDIFAMDLNANETTLLSHTYEGDTTAGFSTQYTLIDSQFNRLTNGTITTAHSNIRYTAEQSGTHYLALYGMRSTYRIEREVEQALADDWFFSPNTATGPNSWQYGPITLNQLNFNNQDLLNRNISCTSFVTGLDGSAAVYTTPSHFSGIHEYVFTDTSAYTMDGEQQYGWQITQGDITSAHWYDNSYLGWAENIGDGGWRYWDLEGMSYVECNMN